MSNFWASLQRNPRNIYICDDRRAILVTHMWIVCIKNQSIICQKKCSLYKQFISGILCAKSDKCAVNARDRNLRYTWMAELGYCSVCSYNSEQFTFGTCMLYVIYAPSPSDVSLMLFIIVSVHTLFGGAQIKTVRSDVYAMCFMRIKRYTSLI